MSARLAILGLFIAACVGCTPNAGSPETAESAAAAPAAAPAPVAAPAPAAAAPAQVSTEPAQLAAPQQPRASPAAPTAAPAPAAPANQPPADGNERVAAKAGVGKQGQSLKEHSGVIVEAAKAFFNVRQKAVFEMQIPSTMKLFEAQEGRKPNSHEEFMSKIIEAGGIKLPDLPAGNRYVYDPQKGELMVEKPAR